MIHFESKKDYNAREEQPPYLRSLVWNHETVRHYEYRLLLLYSDTNSKENKAIYLKTFEEAKKLENFFRFLVIKSSGMDIAKQISKFMIYFKTNASGFLATSLSTISMQFRFRVEGEKKEEEVKPERLEMEVKQSEVKAYMDELRSVAEFCLIEAVSHLFKDWKAFTNKRHKDEEESKKLEIDKKKQVVKALSDNHWLTSLNSHVINEVFFQKWLWAALQTRKQEADEAKKPAPYKLTFIQIETPMGNWMDLFKPIVLVSGQFMPKNLIDTSPSRSPLKALFLNKTDSVRKKNNTFSLSSMDCYIREKKEDKLIWDVSPDDPKNLKSGDLEIMNCIYIEFLDEGAQNSDSFQKGQSHRIMLPVALLTHVFEILKTPFFWIPLKNLSKKSKTDPYLFLKVFNQEFRRKRLSGVPLDEIYRTELLFKDLTEFSLLSGSKIIIDFLRTKFEIDVAQEKGFDEILICGNEKIKQKYDELSFKSYWCLILRFIETVEEGEQEIRKFSRNGLPNFVRRKIWGRKNKGKYKEIIEFCLKDHWSMRQARKDLQDAKMTDAELFNILLQEANQNFSFTMMASLEMDIKSLELHLSSELLKILGDIFQVLTFWAKLIGRRLVYCFSLLSLVLNVIYAFSNDFLQVYYCENPDFISWMRTFLGLNSFFDILDLRDPSTLASDCFWAIVGMISDFFSDIYLQEENQKESMAFEIKGIRGFLMFFSAYLSETHKNQTDVFEVNEGAPLGVELAFGEWFLDLLGSAGFRKESLFRIWDILFSFEELTEKNTTYSSFITATVSVLLTRLKDVKFKNFREFKNYLRLYLISVEGFEDFVSEILKECCQINEFLNRKWHVWVENEALLVKSSLYYQHYLQLTSAFLKKSEKFGQSSFIKTKSSFGKSEIINNGEGKKDSLHIFLYEANIYHSETAFLIELEHNSLSCVYQCDQNHKNRVTLNLYQNFPFEGSQKCLKINIYDDNGPKYLDNHYSPNSEETIEDILSLADTSPEPCHHVVNTTPSEFRDPLFSLEVDLSGIVKGLIHKRLFKLKKTKKSQVFFSSEIELAILISESEILRESYFSKPMPIFHTASSGNLTTLAEKEGVYFDSFKEIYLSIENQKNSATLMSEKAGNTFFLIEESCEPLWLKYSELQARMALTGLTNEAAVRWVFESLKLLSAKEKKSRADGIHITDFAASLYLLDQTKGLKFLFGGNPQGKTPVLFAKLFLSSLYKLLGFFGKQHCIENFIDSALNRNAAARISKAFLTIGDPEPKTPKFDLTKILREIVVTKHTSFGSKELLLGLDVSLGFLKDILSEETNYQEFFRQLGEDKLGVLTVKYSTVDGIKSMKVFKFDKNWETESHHKANSLKPNENLFFKFINSISMNSQGSAINETQLTSCIKSLPFLNYLLSCKDSFENHKASSEDLFKISRVRVEITINSSLLLVLIIPLENRTLLSKERLDNYVFLASKWKFYSRNQLRELLRTEEEGLNDFEEDLSEKKNNEFVIEVPPVYLFESLKAFVFYVQRELLSFFDVFLETRHPEFLSILKNCKPIQMMDFFRTRLRVCLKNDKNYLNIEESNEWGIAKLFDHGKNPTMVFEYLTPNLDSPILKNSNFITEGFFTLNYPKESLEPRLLYEDLGFFRFTRKEGEWLKAEILGARLKEKQKKMVESGRIGVNGLKTDDFLSFDVRFERFQGEIYVLMAKDVRLRQKNNFHKFIKTH